MVLTNQNSSARPPFDFLAGSGEMAGLMRAHDWENNPLGSPRTWSPTLKTTLRLLLTSNHPMFIWWGPQLIQFYNDAYRQTLGPERHPSALGQPGRQCWKEVWDIISPQIDLVMQGEGATWNEDHYIPVTRHGRRQDVWWTYSYSPIEDETGIQGVLVICKDVTGEHEYRQNLERLNAELAVEVELRKQAQADLSAERDRIDLALVNTQGDLAQQVCDWQQLHRMVTTLLHANGLEEQFRTVLKTVAHFHRSGQGVISLYDEYAGGLVAQTSLGLTEEGLSHLACVPQGAGACGTAFQEKRRVIVEDTDTDPLYVNYRRFAQTQGIRALYSTPFFTLAGEPLGVLSVYFSTPRKPTERELRLTDICVGQIASFVERANAEKQLRQVQERSHQILESMKEGFLLMDRCYRVLQINAEGLRMDGRPMEQIIGRTHWEIWPGSEDLPVGLAYKNLMKERLPVTLEQCYRHFGQDVWLDIRAYPHDDGIAVLYRDITDQKLAERALAEIRQETDRRRRLYETVLSNTPDLVYVFDLEHRFTYANDVLLRMWGKTWGDAIGKTCLELGYEPWHAAMHDREIEVVKETKQPIRGEVPFTGTFGRRFYEYIFVPVIGPEGEVEAVAGTTRDVTERKENEDALRDANRRKDEFLAMLAHELRNPLAPIAAAAELLQLAPVDGRRLQYTSQLISRQVEHLTGLVDDLLDASRVTRGLIALEKTSHDLQQIILSAVEQVRPLIQSRRHHLQLDFTPDPAYVIGDQKRLVQIVANVLNNAAKYTPEGGVIHVKLELDEHEATLTISDSGIGIAADFQSQLFEMFAQAERAADRSQGGLGIGLALVKSLVELHNGSVRCSSEGANKGSQFMITLPRSEKPQQAMDIAGREQVTPAASRKLRILIVDDNADAAEALAMYLESLGHEVLVEHDPVRALKRTTTELFDMCLLDIGLPQMDGNELARRVRSGGRSANTILIAVTGYGQQDDKRHSLAAGFNHHLTKPVNFRQLNRLMSHL